MASEQVCRMLRTFRKTLVVAKEELELNEVEEELQATLKVLRERQERGKGKDTGRRATANAVTESDVENLAVLLGSTVMVDKRMDEEGED